MQILEACTDELGQLFTNLLNSDPEPLPDTGSGLSSSSTLEKKHFNKTLSHIHVRIKHTIGVLKARFSSLRSLPIKISSNEDLIWVSAWIGSCVILYNMLTNERIGAPTDEEITAVLEEEGVAWAEPGPGPEGPVDESFDVQTMIAVEDDV